MFNRYLKNQKGLTLIELLAVIVILGIIAAIAIPAIGNVINNSRDNAALADAQQVIDGAKLYVASKNVDHTGDITMTPEMLEDYVDKAGEFTNVTLSNGLYTIVGHKEANAAATARGNTKTATDGLTESEIQDALNADNVDAPEDPEDPEAAG